MGLNWVRKYERVLCPSCKRSISAYIPHFGDGTGLRLVKHNVNAPGQLARRRHATRPCELGGRIIVSDGGGQWRLDA